MFIVNAILGLLMLAGAGIAGWMMSRDELNFGVLQSIIALLLLMLAIAVAAFSQSWTMRLRDWLGRRRSMR